MQPEHRLTLGYVQAHPLEAARRLEGLGAKEAATILGTLPPSDIASVLEHCLPGPASKIVSCLPKTSACEALAALSASTAISVLRQFEESDQNELLDPLEQAIGSSLRRAMNYPSQTAGSLADPRVFTLPPDIDVQEALEIGRAHV
jgi:Mg/Co/Ni transporter MgtE